MSPLSRPRAVFSLASLVLVTLALLHGCDGGPTGIDGRRFPCAQDDECISGYVCREGECQPEGDPVDVPDGSVPDGGGPDGGPDGGRPDSGVPDSGMPDSGMPDSGVPDAGPVLRPTQLAFVTPPYTVETNACTANAVEIETQTADGGAAPVASSTVVNLRARNGNMIFYTSRNCSNARTSVTIGAGSTRASFFFRGSTVGLNPVDISATGLAGASQDEIIRSGAPTAVAFVSAAQTVQAGACSAAVVLEARNAVGSATVFSSPTSAGVTVSPAEGFTLFSDAACTTPLTDVTFAAGATRTSFYFRGKTGSTFILAAQPAGLPRATQLETILPVVRTDTCTLENGARTVVCPISPAQLDVSKTLLIYQATSTSNDAHSANVLCVLSSTSAVTCNRAGNTGDVEVSWQTAELASGLKVQQQAVLCNGQSTLPVPIQAVANTGNTFLLVGSQVDGSTQGADDFFTATLAAADRVEVQFGTTCTSTWRGAVQVVEVTGASVTRGATATMAGTQLTVTGLPAVDPATTVLLFTYRVASTTQPGICDRVLRGELTSPTSLTFSRAAGATGCEDAVIESISWERIELGTRGQAQHLDVALDNATSGTQLTISPVDPTRTLVFSSSQALSGQGGGEGSYAGDDNLGTVMGHHLLVSPTVLEVHRDLSAGKARWFSTVLQLEP